MAAIYGILGDADPSELQAMGERLSHRGGEGAHWSLGPSVHLGQRRVAGRGPAIMSDLPIALDAVVENLDQLESLLPGPRPPSDNAAQVVLALFQNLGPDAFRQIRGAFALAIWDQTSDRLILARDLFGARSLFYALAGDRLAFASEYKALLALPDVSNAPDLRILQSINFTRTSVLDGSCLSPRAPGAFGTLAVRRGLTHRKAALLGPRGQDCVSLRCRARACVSRWLPGCGPAADRLL